MKLCKLTKSPTYPAAQISQIAAKHLSVILGLLQ